MITLTLVRHAESELNLDRSRVGGQSPWCELSSRGRAQATALGEHWRATGFDADRICCSSAVRAMQTARLTLDAMHTSPWRIEPHHDLVEASMGQWEGQPRHEVIPPEVASRMVHDGWGFTPPGGESPAAVAARMMDWLAREVLADPAPRHVLVFSHGIAIRALLVALLELPHDAWASLPIENTSVSTLRFTQGALSAHTLNDTTHLRERGIARLRGATDPAQVSAHEAPA